MNERFKEPSVSGNYIINLLLNIFLISVTLILTPYVSRKLGAENIGIYSYCLSIETYFIVAGSLGIPTHARREIASNRHDRSKLDAVYSELIMLQILLLLVSGLIYVLMIAAAGGRYKLMFLICGIQIISALIDISWLYIGMENFKPIVRRNVIFKLLNTVLIFIFVKSSDDLYIYAFAIMISNVVGNMYYFINIHKIVSFSMPKLSDLKKHIRPSFILLLPAMVTTVYAAIDKTMLGLISGSMAEVGFYEQSQKIVTVVLTLIVSLGSVLMPRLAALYSENDSEHFRRYMNNGISAICVVSLPMTVGLFVISGSLVPWFYGPGFDKITMLLKFFAPTLFCMGISDLIGSQMLVAIRKEKELLIINLASTALNLCMNALLIPHYLSYGAACATLISEAVKVVWCFIIGRKYMDVRGAVISILKYAFISIIMGAVVWCMHSKWLTASTIPNTVLLIVIGSIVYAAILLLMKDEWIKTACSVLKNKLN